MRGRGGAGLGGPVVERNEGEGVCGAAQFRFAQPDKQITDQHCGGVGAGGVFDQFQDHLRLPDGVEVGVGPILRREVRQGVVVVKCRCGRQFQPCWPPAFRLAGVMDADRDDVGGPDRKARNANVQRHDMDAAKAVGVCAQPFVIGGGVEDGLRFAALARTGQT